MRNQKENARYFYIQHKERVKRETVAYKKTHIATKLIIPERILNKFWSGRVYTVSPTNSKIEYCPIQAIKHKLRFKFRILCVSNLGSLLFDVLVLEQVLLWELKYSAKKRKDGAYVYEI